MTFTRSLDIIQRFKMKNVIFIVGLPGSGKTHLANRINRDNNGIFHIINDPTNFEKDIKPYLGNNLIITDPHLIFKKNRDLAESKISKLLPETKIDWFFFENNPKQCLINSRNRGKKVSSFITNFYKYYHIPEKSNLVSVYSNRDFN